MKRLFAILASLSLVSSAYAGGPGTTTGDLLKMPIGARAIGMGEAFTAMADDSSAIYWNPAGLSFLKQKEVSFMHSSIIESINYEHLAFVAPGDSYAFGTNFSYLGYGDIAGYDNNGAAIGDIDAYSYVFNGAISRSFHESLSIGLSGGLIHQTLADDSANTFALTAGALYNLPWHALDGDYRLGMAVQNMGPGLKFVNESAPLPRKIKFGGAAEHIKKIPLNLTADISVPNDNDFYFSMGSEYWFKDLLALRLGYAGSNDEGRGLRVGFGVKYKSLLFDYAYAGYGDFGATNRVNLSMRFGDRVRQLNNEERAILKEARAAEKRGAYVPAIMSYNELLDRDPANDRVLKYMIGAHHKMAKENVNEAVAHQAVPIPSPEDAALAELAPEGDGTNVAQGAKKTNDPLGLENLPEVNALDAGVQSSPVTPMPKRTEPPSPNAPALSPADIYGN